ncbi:hypothetical protein [Nesterenkonia sp. CF4.4]|uniref:hypothetical protein n=1 Tax=Nesterenkonia sp. CF4.4 TaxID=3373079 RepID=UPI003EE64096
MSQVAEAETVEAAKPKGVIYWLVRVIIVFVAAVWAIGHFFEGLVLITGRYLWTDGTVEPGLPLERLPMLNQADLRPGTSGTLEDAELSLRLLNAVPLFLETLTVVVAAWLLARVLRRVAEREAFSPTAISGWRALSTTLIVGGVLIGIINTIAVAYLNSYLGLLPSTGAPDPEGTEQLLGGDYSAIAVDLPYWPVTIIVGGLIALALTTAFRAGAQLERDVDGVI